MNLFFKQMLRRIVAFLSQYDRPYNDEIVLSLILNTAQLALMKNEYVEFAPLRGVCGTFKLTGNALPCFLYTVFEKKLMEFIEVRVEISKPDRIQFFSKIVSTDPAFNGKEVETKEKYKEPFNQLALYLHTYFPFPMEGGRKKKNESIQEVQNEDGDPSEPKAVHRSKS
jgi:hypothetical protein